MPKKTTRQVEKVEFKAFASIAKQLDMPLPDLVQAIGQSRSNATHWERRAWVSKTAYLAAEGLLRRSRKKATSSTLLLVTVPNRKLEASQLITKGLELKVVQIEEGI